MSGVPVVPISNFTFTLFSSSSTRFSPRFGNVALRRPEQAPIQIPTPGFLVSTSRGVVPHLSFDRYKSTDPLRWAHIPFETFLEHTPPVPTLQSGTNPLHAFLGFSPAHHLLSMSARDPNDGREMPPNGHNHVSVCGLRGVRKLSPAEWRSYALACRPDIIVALSDTPFTNPPYSQKRLTKSIERSAAWIATLLNDNDNLNVVAHMAGGSSIPARKAFADSLLEPLYGPEADAIKPYRSLDQGIVGYTFDLVPLRLSLEADKANNELVPLLQTTLARLPISKPRFVNSTQTPHEVLRLISSVGIDLFDAHWIQSAANIGVALDFRFPVVDSSSQHGHLGHNLYHTRYASNFSSLADSFRGAYEEEDGRPVCRCDACSPIHPSVHIFHGVDETEETDIGSLNYSPPFTRAYIHHLLHTHEMSAHSFLVMHNLAMLDSFFEGIRHVLEKRPEQWGVEVDKFSVRYGEGLEVMNEARINWREVDKARGKGRLAREKVKRGEGTSIEDEDDI